MVDVSEMEAEEKHWLAHVYQGSRMPELNPKILILGVLLGSLLISSNIYMGLKTGWTEGGSIIAAILAFAIMRAFGGKISILENNIAQTTASAAASLGIMVSIIPALIVMGYQFSALQLFGWILMVSILGILFAVPLRKQLVVIEKLTFPSGTACANTIIAMHAHGANAIKKAKALAISGVLAAIITWFRDAVPAIVPAISGFPGKIMGFPVARLTIGINWSPMLLGVGYLVGPRIGISLLLGAVIGWGILAPVLANAEIIEGIGYRQISHWTMWVAIALMVSSGFTAMLLNGRVVIRAFKSMMAARFGAANQLEFSFLVWSTGMALASLLIAILMKMVFHIPVWMSFLAIVLSYLFALVAIRAYGETDINPVGTMGHATQIAFGAIAPGQVIPNIMAAGITAAGADQSADMMQDLKTGYLLGATPRRQTYAQIIGATFGAIVAVPVFLMITEHYGIGSETLPAPGAMLWSGMAKLLASGFSTLPAYTGYGILCGILLGILLPILERKVGKRYTPSAIGMGIAMIVPAFFGVAMFLGSVIRFGVDRFYPDWSREYSAPIASGAIAGEGITGVLIALLGVLAIL